MYVHMNVKDIFAILPTSVRKSLIYRLFPSLVKRLKANPALLLAIFFTRAPLSECLEQATFGGEKDA